VKSADGAVPQNGPGIRQPFRPLQFDRNEWCVGVRTRGVFALVRKHVPGSQGANRNCERRVDGTTALFL